MEIQGTRTSISEFDTTIGIDRKSYAAHPALVTNILQHFKLRDVVTCELKPDGSLKNMVLVHREGYR